jgi:hypothetical protein
MISYVFFHPLVDKAILVLTFASINVFNSVQNCEKYGGILPRSAIGFLSKPYAMIISRSGLQSGNISVQ